MCCIVGYVGTEVRAAGAAALLRRMCGALAHRGPDGEGVHVGVGMGFGHRRLSVIDLSAGAAQPMASATGRKGGNARACALGTDDRERRGRTVGVGLIASPESAGEMRENESCASPGGADVLCITRVEALLKAQFHPRCPS